VAGSDAPGHEKAERRRRRRRRVIWTCDKDLLTSSKN